jgi:hypothetical protein
MAYPPTGALLALHAFQFFMGLFVGLYLQEAAILPWPSHIIQPSTPRSTYADVYPEFCEKWDLAIAFDIIDIAPPRFPTAAAPAFSSGTPNRLLARPGQTQNRLSAALFAKAAVSSTARLFMLVHSLFH